jgi:hypothetical protein
MRRGFEGERESEEGKKREPEGERVRRERETRVATCSSPQNATNKIVAPNCWLANILAVSSTTATPLASSSAPTR